MTTGLKTKGPYRPFTGMNTLFMGRGNTIGNRAVSAGVTVRNPKMRKYENLIAKLKRVYENEKKHLRQVKTLCSKEIDQKNQLEKILRQCVDDVKGEINKKRTEGKATFYNNPRKMMMHRMPQAGDVHEEFQQLDVAEKEKILEVLVSQERVLTLLYDKTFPPRAQSAPAVNINLGKKYK